MGELEDFITKETARANAESQNHATAANQLRQQVDALAQEYVHLAQQAGISPVQYGLLEPRTRRFGRPELIFHHSFTAFPPIDYTPDGYGYLGTPFIVRPDGSWTLGATTVTDSNGQRYAGSLNRYETPFRGPSGRGYGPIDPLLLDKHGTPPKTSTRITGYTSLPLYAVGPDLMHSTSTEPNDIPDDLELLKRNMMITLTRNQ